MSRIQYCIPPQRLWLSWCVSNIITCVLVRESREIWWPPVKADGDITQWLTQHQTETSEVLPPGVAGTDRRGIQPSAQLTFPSTGSFHDDWHAVLFVRAIFCLAGKTIYMWMCSFSAVTDRYCVIGGVMTPRSDGEMGGMKRIELSFSLTLAELNES